MDSVHANGVRFAYLSAGPANGPLALLLHGFPDSPHTWSDTLPALGARGFRAVAPFMRGYHPTAVPSDGKYDSETLGRDAIALIAALGADKAVVIGHDWGAGAAYAAASLAPERVRQLITVGIPHPAAMFPTPRIIWGVRHFFTLSRRGAAERMRANNFQQLDELVSRWSPHWKVPPDETRAVKEIFAHPESLDAALGYYRALSVRVPASMKKKIAVPSVSFAGEQDSVLRVSDFEKARKMYAASYEVVAMPGGHFLHREHPERFVSELLRVLPSL
jgi:pimeloyl-ACP methyl ester carboxylesterase